MGTTKQSRKKKIDLIYSGPDQQNEHGVKKKNPRNENRRDFPLGGI